MHTPGSAVPTLVTARIHIHYFNNLWERIRVFLVNNVICGERVDLHSTAPLIPKPDFQGIYPEPVKDDNKPESYVSR